MRFFIACLPFLLLVSVSGFSRDSLGFFQRSVKFNKPRFITAATVQTAGYGVSLVFLNAAWYTDYPQTKFHSFDDFPEWVQMDKAGHVITSWYLGRMGSSIYEWSGVPKRKAALYGAIGGWTYLTAIEIFDGFSEGWGFSWSDFGANTIGTSLIIMQKGTCVNVGSIRKIKGERSEKHRNRNWFAGLSLKYSFHQTGFPEYRPTLLGKKLSEQLVKDYNGQTYWVSFNLASQFWEESKFPKWLNLALGYGGEGMISGRDEFVTLEDGSTLWMERYRQYYLSLDIDLTRIKTKSHFLKALAETFCFIKIPAPAIEFSRKGIKGHAIYF